MEFRHFNARRAFLYPSADEPADISKENHTMSNALDRIRARVERASTQLPPPTEPSWTPRPNFMEKGAAPGGFRRRFRFRPSHRLDPAGSRRGQSHRAPAARPAAGGSLARARARAAPAGS